MSYQIQYDPHLSKKYPRRYRQKRKSRFLRLTVILLILFLAVGIIGREGLPQFLLPGDAAVTSGALDTMIRDLQNGEQFEEAITAFCVEIIRHGQSK